MDGTAEIEPTPPEATPTADAAVLAELSTIDRDLLQERFVEFERAVLQENIVLCDHKSGVLLAFTGAMVVYCVSELGSHPLGNLHAGVSLIVPAALLVSALAFLASSSFSLSTVMPRIVRGVTEDHIFWEAPAFKLPVEEYVSVMIKLRRPAGAPRKAEASSYPGGDLPKQVRQSAPGHDVRHRRVRGSGGG